MVKEMVKEKIWDNHVVGWNCCHQSKRVKESTNMIIKEEYLDNISIDLCIESITNSPNQFKEKLENIDFVKFEDDNLNMFKIQYSLVGGILIIEQFYIDSNIVNFLKEISLYGEGFKNVGLEVLFSNYVFENIKDYKRVWSDILMRRLYKKTYTAFVTYGKSVEFMKKIVEDFLLEYGFDLSDFNIDTERNEAHGALTVKLIDSEWSRLIFDTTGKNFLLNLYTQYSYANYIL